MNLITLEDVRVELGGRQILAGLTTGIPRGKISALIGANGSGKTTLLRAILKEIPYSGTMRFHCGHDHSKHRPERIGYVPQRLQIDSRLPISVRDLLSLSLQRKPIFLGIRRDVTRRMEAMLERVEATRLLDRPVAGISGGELQRVLLGLALEPTPELLLLDEPAAGVDMPGQEKFYSLISRINKESGVTVLLVSHELQMVSKQAGRVICLRDGHIQCEGAPEEITPEQLMATFGAGTAWFKHHHD